MVRVKGNQELVRQINESLVLDTIRRHGEISRADIARETGLTTGTLSNLTTGLIENGLLVEVGQGTSKGGRKPTILRLRASSRYALGISVGVGEVIVLLLDLAGEPVQRQSEELADEKGPQFVAEVIGRLAGEVLRLEGLTVADLVGAAVSLPATVDSSSGMVYYAPNLRWRNIPFGGLLRGNLGLSVLLENDANASVFGEYWCGATRNVSNGVFIFAEYGIGSGFLVDGEVYRGRDQVAGEFGHTTIDLNGPRCHCGNKGCLGMFASGYAVLRKVREALVGGTPIPFLNGRPPEQIKLADVIEASKAGDPFCKAALREAATYLGVGIANLINLYNPASLVIGGRLALEAPGYWETASAEAAERLYPVFGNQVHLLLSTLGPDVAARGAGSLVMSQLFRPLRVTVPR